MASQSYTSALNAVPEGAGARREQPHVSKRWMSSQYVPSQTIQEKCPGWFAPAA